jgi:hypothetical protein
MGLVVFQAMQMQFLLMLSPVPPRVPVYPTRRLVVGQLLRSIHTRTALCVLGTSPPLLIRLDVLRVQVVAQHELTKYM